MFLLFFFFNRKRGMWLLMVSIFYASNTSLNYMYYVFLMHVLRILKMYYFIPIIYFSSFLPFHNYFIGVSILFDGNFSLMHNFTLNTLNMSLSITMYLPCWFEWFFFFIQERAQAQIYLFLIYRSLEYN